jgi:hypothetical protein
MILETNSLSAFVQSPRREKRSSKRPFYACRRRIRYLAPMQAPVTGLIGSAWKVWPWMIAVDHGLRTWKPPCLFRPTLRTPAAVLFMRLEKFPAAFRTRRGHFIQLFLSKLEVPLSRPSRQVKELPLDLEYHSFEVTRAMFRAKGAASPQ